MINTIKQLRRAIADSEHGMQTGKMTVHRQYVVELIHIAEQLQARVVELESERDVLAVHVERLRSIAFPYISLLPELVDWFDDTPTTSLAERDALSFAAGFRAGCDNPNGSDATDTEIEQAANEYAKRIKRGNP